MRDTFGKVFTEERCFEEDLLGYVEYDGRFHQARTSVQPRLVDLAKNWGTSKAKERCSCKKKVVPHKVYIIVEVGSPVAFESEVCLDCKVLVGNRMPYNNWVDEKHPLYALPNL